ncbi:MAG TPA: hemolysin III family protein [Anaerolineales bacterium]|jgi:hemolysin III
MDTKNIFNRMREPVNGLTHLFAALAGVAGLIALLVVGRADIGKQASLAVYGVTVILLFSASATYHLVKANPQVLEILRKFDHSAIYLLIAGSYTPICYNMFTGFWKWGMLIIIWSFALVGVLIKVFVIKAPRWLNAGVYLVMGWMVVIALKELLTMLPVGALVWLAVGGIIYSLGAVVYITKIFNFVPGKFGFHEVWHIFVILGALAHFIAIIAYVAPAS